MADILILINGRDIGVGSRSGRSLTLGQLLILRRALGSLLPFLEGAAIALMGRTSALAAILRRPATLVIGTATLLTALEGAAVVLPVTLIGWASTLLISLIRRAASLLATLEGAAVVLLAALIGWTSTLLIPLIGGARPFLRIGAGRSWLLGTGCRSRLCLLGLLRSRLSRGGSLLLRLDLRWF